jgi:hypothetical protein
VAVVGSMAAVGSIELEDGSMEGAVVVGSIAALVVAAAGSIAGKPQGVPVPQEANILTFREADSKENSDIVPFVVVVRDSRQMRIWLRHRSPALQWIQVEGVLKDDEVWRLAAEDPGEVPLDVILIDPGKEFADLYRLVDVRSARDVRVSMSARPGFFKAVRLAASLGLPVRLLPQQPTADVLAELQEALAFYLRNPMVEAPIEFFHSTLAWLRGAPTGSLWRVLEEDPTIYQGKAISTAWNSPQISDLPTGPTQDFGLLFLERLTQQGGECATCRWRDYCAGYFKWPAPEYSCTGVKLLFSDLFAAVKEIEDDFRTFAAPTAELQSSL